MQQRTRRRFLAAVGTTTTVGLAGCVDLFAASEYDVGMTATEFLPETLTVPVGTTVVWENTSSRAHTVTAVDSSIPEGAAFFATGGYANTQEAVEAWDDESGGRMDSEERFEHTFEIPGTYDYICIPHVASDMVGTVVVEE